MQKIRQKPAERVWADFAKDEQLTPEQLEKFQTYASLLLEWNELSNLTALKDLSGVVNQHFIDSMSLRKKFDLTSISSICDIGSGAGFPGLPLKIMFPHLTTFLIEVNGKKRAFLEHVIQTLGLENVIIIDLDWRSFLRSTEEQVDLFVTKAALHEEELIRMFRQNCHYKTSQLIYWASVEWEMDPKAEPYIKEILPYTFKRKERRFIRMSL
ncbi:16S rRNA (guanine(527)-N(7))-methyltransferase RsmG [Candidatus Dependentiae bacterium]|nr:16S rRNA (guanine(527)-N(7))-methyltransferase RsmG [Candidatus Dependentiae bacterium]